LLAEADVIARAGHPDDDQADARAGVEPTVDEGQLGRMSTDGVKTLTRFGAPLERVGPPLPGAKTTPVQKSERADLTFYGLGGRSIP
jgi:hypothetical protein